MTVVILPYPFLPDGGKAQEGDADPAAVCAPQGLASDGQAVAAALEKAGIFQPLTDRLALSYIVYPVRPANWRHLARARPVYWDDALPCIGFDRAQAWLLKVLKGRLFADCRQIRQLRGERAYPDGTARIVLSVEPAVDTGVADAREEAAADAVTPTGSALSAGAAVEGVVYSDEAMSFATRFPIDCHVRTPSGRLAAVRRHLSGASKHDHFERVICEYIDGRRPNDWVTLQPRFLSRVDEAGG